MVPFWLKLFLQLVCFILFNIFVLVFPSIHLAFNSRDVWIHEWVIIVALQFPSWFCYASSPIVCKYHIILISHRLYSISWPGLLGKYSVRRYLFHNSHFRFSNSRHTPPQLNRSATFRYFNPSSGQPSLCLFGGEARNSTIKPKRGVRQN